MILKNLYAFGLLAMTPMLAISPLSPLLPSAISEIGTRLGLLVFPRADSTSSVTLSANSVFNSVTSKFPNGVSLTTVSSPKFPSK